MVIRRIAVVTGTRAEYGLLRPLIRLIRADKTLRLQMIVTGQHLMRRFGRTVSEIEADRIPIAAKVPLSLDSDSPRAISGAVADGVRGFARAYERLEPDLVVVLGDRYEILAAATAALPFRLPVAHVHGGELTEGLIDDQIRHAVTKLSHLHFVSTAKYRRRVIQLGERPERVFHVGAPGVDGIGRMKLLSRAELDGALGLPRGMRLGLFTYHPLTLSADGGAREVRALLRAMESFPDVHWVCTMPNADTGFEAVFAAVRDFVARNGPSGRACSHSSLGHLRYLSMLACADLMVGNSSSGLIEAPSFGLPVVNVGDRQKGRVRGRNVIDVPAPGHAAVAHAIRRALSTSFRRRAAAAKNPYSRPGTSRLIHRTLKRYPLGERLIKKEFLDRP